MQESLADEIDSRLQKYPLTAKGRAMLITLEKE